MPRSIIFIALFGVVTSTPPALAQSAAPPAPLTSGIQLKDIDHSVRPADDLFQYANGTWLKNNPIPADRASFGVGEEMVEQSLKQQRELLETAQNSSDPEERKVGDLYTSFMDEAAIEKLGTTPLKADLAQIDAAQNAMDVSALIAYFDREGVNVPISGFVSVNSKKSTEYAYWLSQAGLSLPDRDYYLLNDPKLVAVRQKYLAHVSTMLGLLGDTNPDQEAKDIVALETALAKVQWTKVADRDPLKTYNAMTLAQLSKLAPAIDWNAYFKSGHMPNTLPVLIVRQPSYLRALSELVKKTPVAVWKEYFRYQLLSSRAPYLPKAYVDANFAFKGGVITGAKQIPDRWKRGCELVDTLIGEESGKLYVAKYFPPQAKARIDALVQNLLSAYKESINGLDWMSAATKVEARAKLEKINVKIGYPKTWRDYSKLSIDPNDLIGNVTRGIVFENDRKLAQLGGPIDRNEWGMTAPTVNAYYDPELNEIVFPAGILQPPAFDPLADDAFNYGSTGATIGHEMSHGFDDNGSQYDSDGNLRDWWTKADHKAFAAKTAKLIKEYNAFEPVPGFHVNGALTLGENIADIAGLEIAYKAYIASLNGKTPPIIDGMTGDQRFYIGFAQSWLSERREESTISLVKSDPHSPEKYRTNGVVVHMPSFYSAFSVGPTDKMWLAPENRVTLW